MHLWLQNVLFYRACVLGMATRFQIYFWSSSPLRLQNLYFSGGVFREGLQISNINLEFVDTTATKSHFFQGVCFVNCYKYQIYILSSSPLWLQNLIFSGGLFRELLQISNIFLEFVDTTATKSLFFQGVCFVNCYKYDIVY